MIADISLWWESQLSLYPYCSGEIGEGGNTRQSRMGSEFFANTYKEIPAVIMNDRRT
jgi:hypothetical protein